MHSKPSSHRMQAPELTSARERCRSSSALLATSHIDGLGLRALLAVLVCPTRVYGAHYPGDVLGGALVRVAAAGLLQGPPGPTYDPCRVGG